MLTGNTYDVGQVAPVSVLGERQQWEPHGARFALIGNAFAAKQHPKTPQTTKTNENHVQALPWETSWSLLSRSLYHSHVLTTFLGPVLGAMMKQVCWHSRRSKAYRGLPEARGQSEAHGDSNLYETIVGASQ